jgi:prepilin-type N-terminal cleavage/methylation domain-containing protein
MNKRTGRKRGFTLGEVLVTVAIISVLAAVVLPTIAGQLTKGDQSRVSNDLIAMRNGIEQYLSDVRRYPNSIGQLTNRPAAGAVILGSASTLVAPEVARWRGPYITKDSLAADSTGYALAFIGGSPATARVFDTLTVIGTGTARASAGAGIKYLTIAIPGMDTTTAAALDAAMDDGNTQTGLIRWVKKAVSGSDTLKFFAIPYQP